MSSRRSRGQVLRFYGDIDYRAPDERQAAERLELDTSHEPIVYYMRMDRLVKIGWTVNLKRRVETIGPQGVIAIEFGGYELERTRHKQFVADHSHLEWFWLRGALTAHIIEMRTAIETNLAMTTEQWLDLHGVRSTALPEGGTNE